MKRVVITGMGIVSPVGTGVEYAWKNLLAGKSGVRKITEFFICAWNLKGCNSANKSSDCNQNIGRIPKPIHFILQNKSVIYNNYITPDKINTIL